MSNDSGNKGFFTASGWKNSQRGEARRRKRKTAEELEKEEAIREVATHVKFTEDREKEEAIRAADERDRATKKADIKRRRKAEEAED